MSDFLLELLSEEIPARMQAKARADLARLFEAELAKSGLAATGIETYATPRRLALIVRGLPLGTPAVSEELKGPRTSAPPQALEGFLRKTGLSQDQLTDRDGIWFAVLEKPGRATTDVLAEAIPAIVRAFPWPRSMRWGAASLSTESLRWVRPLQGIVAMLDEEVVELEIGDVTSGAATVGHRFHHPGAITLAGAKDYVEKLRACHVIVDQEERARLIREGAAAAASAAGLGVVPDEGLVEENAGLTEWPVPLLGRFDPAFLEVPREVIQLTMRTNQKYFACRPHPSAASPLPPSPDGRGKGPAAEGGGKGEGELANAFICVANIAAADGGAKIVEGNQKVLAARLSDARFFWEQDLKIPLEEQAQKLSQIVFHEKLGTVADKVERVAKLARWLVEEGIVGGNNKNAAHVERSRDTGSTGDLGQPGFSTSLETNGAGDLATLAERAARLCKADLVTQMVGEFPELQGLIGGYLAAAQGEDPQVAEAIRDHYKPVGQGDDVPTAPVTVAVSLADKLDTLVCFFVTDQPPTGSKDPFALRRAAISTASIIETSGLRVPLLVTMANAVAGLVETSFDWCERSQAVSSETIENWRGLIKANQFHGRLELLASAKSELADVKADAEAAIALLRRLKISLDELITKLLGILDFLADRLKVQQREAGVRHDLIDAVFALGGEDDLVRLLARVRALQAFVETPEGRDLLAGYKRAANILKKENWASEQGENKTLSYTPENEENALIAALDSAEPRAAQAIAAEDFEGAMAALASLRGPVDAFFEKVTVNDPDSAKREARLNLLARIRNAVHQVADFSRIEG